jgi:hypothetical protein
MMSASRRSRFLLAAVALVSAACGGEEGAGEIRARKLLLEREVQGLRALVASLERREPILPAGDIVIAFDEALIRDLVAAQLPLEGDVDRFHIRLTRADVLLEGSALVKLHGMLALRDQPEIAGEVSLQGALENVAIDEASGTLRAALGVDHLDIEKAGGLESVLTASSLDELGGAVRPQLQAMLPAIEIPVKVQQGIVLPAVEDGPFRLQGGTLPLRVSVSRVFAGRGRLWVGVSVRPGAFVTTRAPARGTAR